MRAVDTNVIVRLLTRDDPGQVRVAEAFVARGVWVSHVVIAETTWVLGKMYGFGHDRIAAALEMLLELETVSVQDADVVVSAVQLYRQRPSLRFPDCLILRLAQKAGHLPLGTFDLALARIDGAERL